MNKLGIRSQARKPKMYKKLEEIGTYHRYPNVLNRDFVATKPNQKWVTDVTYIRTQQGWAICPPSKTSTMALLWLMSLTATTRLHWSPRP